MIHLFAGPIFTEWYWTPLAFIVLIGPWIVAISVVSYFAYRRFYISKDKTKPALLFIKILTVATLIGIIGFIGYRYYLDNRTGRLNPYTELCIEAGYAGAKGRSCRN